MEKERKFNYGLEFYYQNLYSLDNPKEFKKRVEEAKSIEEYFNKILPNVEYIRPYVLLSYRMNKEILNKDRINYIKGLVYALDYIDINDIKSIPEEYEYVDKEYKELFNSDKTSRWKSTGYSADENVEENLLYNEEEDIDYDLLSRISEKNTISITPKSFDELNEIINNSGLNNDDSTTLLEENDVEEKIKKTRQELEEQYGNIPVELNISIEDKIEIFKKHSKQYIDSCVNFQLNNNKLVPSDIPMFMMAMDDWFTYVFGIMDDLITIRENTLKYKNKNIVNFL